MPIKGPGGTGCFNRRRSRARTVNAPTIRGRCSLIIGTQAPNAWTLVSWLVGVLGSPPLSTRFPNATSSVLTVTPTGLTKCSPLLEGRPARRGRALLTRWAGDELVGVRVSCLPLLLVISRVQRHLEVRGLIVRFEFLLGIVDIVNQVREHRFAVAPTLEIRPGRNRLTALVEG